MNDFIKYILLNFGRFTGALLGLVISVLIINIGITNTLFIILCVALGFLIGKFFDEGGNLKKTLKEIMSAMRVDKWH